MVEPQYRWIPTMQAAYTRRLGRYERQVEQRYPGLLQQIGAATPTIRAHTPAWCPLPIGAVMGLGVPAPDASAVTAIAAWRMAGRHVAYVHPDRLPPPINHVPVDEIKRLPVRCIYVATSDADGQPPSGFFLWLEYDEAEDRTEVRMQLDLPEVRDLWATITDPVHVVRGDLREAVSATWTTAFMRGSDVLGVAMPPVGRGTTLDLRLDEKTTHAAHLLAAVAYLAAPTVIVVDAAEVLGQPARAWDAPGQGDSLALWLAH